LKVICHGSAELFDWSRQAALKVAILIQQPLTRIGILGDIHAESTALHTALQFLQNLHLPIIFCVGDIVDGSGDVDVCCQLLQQYQVVTVRGNHDDWFLENQLRDLPEATLPSNIKQESTIFITNLPETSEFRTLAGDLLLCHGLGRNNMARLTPDDHG
jgi:predicted phosphodiesterase